MAILDLLFGGAGVCCLHAIVRYGCWQGAPAIDLTADHLSTQVAAQAAAERALSELTAAMDASSYFSSCFGATDIRVEQAGLRLFVIISVHLNSGWEVFEEKVATAAKRLRHFDKRYGDALLGLVKPQELEQIQESEHTRLIATTQF